MDSRPAIVRRRWDAFLNDSGEAIPAYACLEVSQAAGEDFLRAIKPTGGADAVIMFSGQVEVPIGGTGTCSCDIPVQALYDSGDGEPTTGTEWGPVAGSWALSTSGTGYRSYGKILDEFAFFEKIGGTSGGGAGSPIVPFLIRFDELTPSKFKLHLATKFVPKVTNIGGLTWITTPCLAFLANEKKPANTTHKYPGFLVSNDPLENLAAQVYYPGTGYLSVHGAHDTVCCESDFAEGEVVETSGQVNEPTTCAEEAACLDNRTSTNWKVTIAGWPDEDNNGTNPYYWYGTPPIFTTAGVNREHVLLGNGETCSGVRIYSYTANRDGVFGAAPSITDTGSSKYVSRDLDFFNDDQLSLTFQFYTLPVTGDVQCRFYLQGTVLDSTASFLMVFEATITAGDWSCQEAITLDYKEEYSQFAGNSYDPTPGSPWQTTFRYAIDWLPSVTIEPA